MKINAKLIGQLNTGIAEKVTRQASQLGVRDTVIAIWHDTVRDSPVSAKWPSIAKDGRRPTGNNKRSISVEVSGMGTIAGSGSERIVDDTKIEGAVYFTSGYGGYLEVGTQHMDGTVKMPARPYIRPSFDIHSKKMSDNIGRQMKTR